MICVPWSALGKLKLTAITVFAFALAACSSERPDFGKATGNNGPGIAGTTGDASDAGPVGSGGDGNTTEPGNTSGAGSAGDTGNESSGGSSEPGPDSNNATCDTNNGGCDPLVACNMTDGKVSCGACPSGYDDANGNGTSCAPVDCGELTAPSNGKVETPAGTAYEAEATYSCDAGYELSGEAMRTCESSGTWSASEPSCVNIDECDGNPCDSGDDAEATCEEAAPGAGYTCTCSAGYVASAGAAPVCNEIQGCDDNTVCTADYPCQDLPPPSTGYTCRGQFADWTPVDSPNTLSVNANGTVTDSRTGLLWQRALPAGSYDWEGAKAYCENLSLAGTGWRLPTGAELLSIVDFSRSEPAISLAAFPNTPGTSSFWTSSPWISADSAGGVGFGYGQVSGVSMNATSRVRCVRSEAPAVASDGSGGAPPGRYTISDGTVYDNRTRLTWQQTVPVAPDAVGCTGSTCTQAGAIAYCAGLSLAGGGWRLPKISEVFTLVDSTSGSPMIDEAAFPATPRAFFATSSLAANSTLGWSFEFGEGYSDFGGGGRVRCVR